MKPADRQQFLSLVQRVQEGSQEAADQLYNEFAELVRRFARRYLRQTRELRTLFDSLDFTQDVFLSFFTRVIPRQSFESPEHLRAFLQGMVENKVLAARRQWMEAAKRDLRRAKSLNAIPAAAQASGRESDAAGTVDALDGVEHLGPSKPGMLKLILDLKILGRSPGEIAQELGLSVQQVQETLRRVKDSLTQGRRHPTPV